MENFTSITTRNLFIMLLAAIVIVTVIFLFTPISRAQEQSQPEFERGGTFIILGTNGPDTITVSDRESVICGSEGVTVEGVGIELVQEVLKEADPACPNSDAGHTRWINFDGKADNLFTGDFGGGDDRYTRVDGPGNDQYQYFAGDGDDVITSSDGPGNDVYLYNNGPGNDSSVHANNTPDISSGNDLYRINGGPGEDKGVVNGDGPGNDLYSFINFESINYTDDYPDDRDELALLGLRDE